MFDPIFHLGTTSSWFLNLISWLLLQISVTSLVACIMVWLYVTFSHLHGYTLSTPWSLQSWYFLFPYVSWTLVDVYVASSSCACLFMSGSNLFQNSIFRIIPKSLLRALDILWGGLVTDLGRGDALLRIVWHWHGGLPNYFYIALDGDAELFQINLYSAWWRYWICISLDGAAASCRLNLHVAWWRYWICIALDRALQFL